MGVFLFYLYAFDLYLQTYPQSRLVPPASEPACQPALRSCHGRCWRRAQRGQTLECPATIKQQDEETAQMEKKTNKTDAVVQQIVSEGPYMCQLLLYYL
uniref:Uncharacterized protein n=1 Tax=Neogobius melanostomus TaxID=47308 RepID=A0A8C6U710_9GOBI